jgi:DNA-binding transcriptional regulator GbsR (MarR family)
MKSNTMEQHRHKIEQYGVLMEQNGLSPVAARVLIYLLLHPQAEASFEELVDFFKVSKSAVSNALKTLTTISMVHYRTKPGQRKRYFYVQLNQWFSIQNAVRKYAMVRQMMADLKGLRSIDDEFSRDMQDVVDFFTMLEHEYPVIYERWKKIRDMRKD